MITKFKINDEWYSADLAALPANITLNKFIRDYAKLTATKYMCQEGGCGACIVTIKGKHPGTGKMMTWAANSCLTFLNSCIDWEITTCEGIGNKSKGYHPIQKRMAKLSATQCGFCSPGFVMNMYSLLESKNNKVTMEEIENSFSGNICRCTGYRPILDAMKGFASDKIGSIPDECRDIEDLTTKICPKSKQMCTGSCRNTMKILTYDDGSEWCWPKTLDELFEIFENITSDDEYTFVAGNTAYGSSFRSEKIKHYIDINGIPDLKKYYMSKEKLTLGANLTLAETMDIFKDVAKQPGFEYCAQLWRHFDLIANVPVRNNGTLAGNISLKKMRRDFNSDIFILFEALNAPMIIATKASDRKRLTLTEYMDSKITKSIILAFELPVYPKDKAIFKSYKIMPRAQNANAYVNAGILLNLDVATGIVAEARCCFGGISPDFAHATELEKLLEKQNFHDKEIVSKIFSELSKSLKPNDVLPATSPEYRRKLACGLMFKFLLANAPSEKVKPEFMSGASILKRNLSSGVQMFDTQKNNYPVSEPVQKIEALIQCSGEASYINDMLAPDNTVHCAFVNATVVSGSIEQIISKEALAVPGVIAFYSAKDIPGNNTFVCSEFSYDVEEIFSSGKVRFYDQPLGMIVAKTREIAQFAATKVKVIYSIGDHEVMSTIQDVLDNKCLERIHSSNASDCENLKLSDNADFNGKGMFEMGLQYHFTMEPHACVTVPFEQGLEVYSSTQWMDHTQAAIAKMLKIKAADVQMRIRRVGGGYGAKITGGNRVACAAALAAYKLNRPARFIQSIESMMNTVGKRWACRSEYEFHAKADGKIVGVKNTFYEDAGCTLNENPIPNYTLPSTKNCYEFTADNFKVDGKAVITDAPSSLFFRAPGALEAIAMMENTVEHAAFEAGLDPADVRHINLQPEHKMKELLPQFLTSREYKKRRQEIDDFNSKNRWMKRGIGLSIMEYKCHFLGGYTATVSVYHVDGSVAICHGGMEMGQGLNTKVVQVAAYFLGVPLENVKIEANNTVCGASCLDTSSSVTSECVCYAVRKCCESLKERLKPIKESLKSNATWKDIVQAAWVKSISLVASEAFQLGDMVNYSVYGLALTEVEVDILTGNLIVKRVDILEDCGESLNPNIDIGQVEGAFIMAMGYWLTEQLVYDRQTGKLLTNNTLTYKPPGAKDIPVDFRIELLKGSSNSVGFMGSKATGEPPACLAVSAIFAIQHALQSARNDAGLPKQWVRLGAPTTPETIVLNAGHDVSSFALE